MKRSVEALVRMEKVVVAVALCAVAFLGGTARAAEPVARIDASAWLTQFAAAGDVTTAARFHVLTSFATDTPGAEPFTIQKAVIYFPDRAGTNGEHFPSCDAAQIERFNGDVRRCPKGSRLGGGTVTAQALQLGVTANGRVAIFNSHRGKSVTFNIQAFNPAYINESIDAPLTQLRGRYGEKLTLVVPHSLQEILTGVFVGVRRFDVTIGGAVLHKGVRYSFLRARRCPTRAMHGVFDLKNWTTGQTATVTADTKVRCRA